jgi:membrane-associated protease RseP (regulator of RpoE activity)
LAYFWVVWSALLLVHEGGHALVAAYQGFTVRSVTVGAGPVLWRGEHGEIQGVLRLVPLVGFTRLSDASEQAIRGLSDWSSWREQIATLAGGTLATLIVALGLAAAVAVRERHTRTRWVLGRFIVADALVLTVFNFLPVPPLDGGRAVIGAISAWRGAPLAADTLFWVQLGGVAFAVVPMLLWTRWTSFIDSTALRWRAPREAPPPIAGSGAAAPSTRRVA